MRMNLKKKWLVLTLLLGASGAAAGAESLRDMRPEELASPSVPQVSGVSHVEGDEKKPLSANENTLELDIKLESEKNISPVRQALKRAAWYGAHNPERALQEYDHILEKWPDALELPEALFGRAQALFALGRMMDAFVSVEKSFPSRPILAELDKRNALELKIGQAMLALGSAEAPVLPDGDQKKKWSGFDAASRVFEAIVYNDPEGAYAAKALLLLGDAYQKAGVTDKAEAVYRRLVSEFPSSEWLDAAKLGSARCLLTRMEQGDRIRSEDLQEARRLLQGVQSEKKKPEEVRSEAARSGDSREGDMATPQQDVINMHDELTARLQAQKALKMMEQARIYLRSHRSESRRGAVFLLREICSAYPNTPTAEDARQELTRLGVPIAETKESP